MARRAQAHQPARRGVAAMTRCVLALLAFALSTAPYTITLAADVQAAARFGGPDAVENQIAEDAAPSKGFIDERLLEPWFDWKSSFAEETGISFGLDYSALYLGTSNSPGRGSASGGMARFFGSWDLVGRGTQNTGALVWKVEHRHAYGPAAPGGFGLGELGYVGIVGPPWSDQGGRLTNLYWRQRFLDGRATVIGGYLDATDYADTFIGASPWTGFTNLVFSTGSASMFLPNDATLGAAAGAMLGQAFYVVGGITNAFSDPTNPFDRSFDRFFNDSEHFVSMEFGWTASQERIYQDNAHVTVWHVGDSAQAGSTDGWGVAFSLVRSLTDGWTPFLRGGFADDGGSLLKRSVSVGVLYQPEGSDDLFGVGLNWGRPNESTFGPGLDDQTTAEVFYRFHVAPQFAITPSLQFIKDPALNPEDDSNWVVGVRARLAL